MKETIKSIIEWHEQTFGDAETLEGQIEKFHTEYHEWIKSRHITTEGKIIGDISELADMAIVAAGIGRFDCAMSIKYLGDVYNEICNNYLTKYDLEEAIDAKMAKNRARKWTPQNGSFQHVEE